MHNKQLDNLVKIGQLKSEPFAQSEFDTYIRSGKERLQDASSPGISLSGKFLLGYGVGKTFFADAEGKHWEHWVKVEAMLQNKSTT